MQPELDVRGDSLLERIEPQLLQAPDLSLRELLAREVSQRGASPERECRPEQPGALGRRQVASLREQSLEADGIDRVRLDGDDVAGCARREHVGAEHAPQLRDAVLQRRRRGLRCALTPEQVYEPVGRDNLAVMHEERRQEGPLPWSAELDRQAVEQNLERAKNPELTHVRDILTSSEPGDNGRGADS